MEEYHSLFREAGFCVYYEEDASDSLLQLFGQLLLDGGEEAVREAIGLSREERKRISIHHLDEILYREPDLVWYEASLTSEWSLKIGWQGNPAADCCGPGLTERLERSIRTEYPELKTTFVPAVFRTGKRKLGMEDEDRSDL